MMALRLFVAKHMYHRIFIIVHHRLTFQPESELRESFQERERSDIINELSKCL
jgi:hypothetical protein